VIKRWNIEKHGSLNRSKLKRGGNTVNKALFFHHLVALLQKQIGEETGRYELKSVKRNLYIWFFRHPDNLNKQYTVVHGNWKP
jgi:hypothetical protein